MSQRMQDLIREAHGLLRHEPIERRVRAILGDTSRAKAGKVFRLCSLVMGSGLASLAAVIQPVPA